MPDTADPNRTVRLLSFMCLLTHNAGWSRNVRIWSCNVQIVCKSKKSKRDQHCCQSLYSSGVVPTGHDPVTP